MAQLNLYDFNRTLEVRIEEIIDFLVNYFDPHNKDLFYILDPYLEPIEIQQAFEDRQYESNIWSFFISMLSDADSLDLKIITRKSTKNLKNPENVYPSKILYPDKTKNIVINICSFKDGQFNNHELHDRWIIKKSILGNLKEFTLVPLYQTLIIRMCH